MAIIANQDLTEGRPEAAFFAGPATALLERCTPGERAPGGGRPQEYAGNRNQSARVSKKVAGPPERAKIRRTMEKGSSLG